MNRGSIDRFALERLESAASMRPRFMNRGSRDQPFSRAFQARGFNEAPIHESGK